MQMMHAMLVHMIYFIYQRNFRVLFANIENINHLDIYGNISSIISGNVFTPKKYSLGDQIQYKIEGK